MDKIRHNIIDKFFSILKSIGLFFVSFFKELAFIIRFLTLLFFVFLESVVTFRINSKKKGDLQISDIKHSKLQTLLHKITAIFDSKESNTIKTSDLINLAFRNLTLKKSRTYVTIGGMAIGFGVIILLLSLGYGFERLVVQRVATLSQLQQIDVYKSQSSKKGLSREAIDKIKGYKEVEEVLPIISSVASVTYSNSLSDVIVYGVNDRFFTETSTQIVEGKYFTDSGFGYSQPLTQVSEEKGVVKGTSSTLVSTDSFATQFSTVKYSISPKVWKPVYNSPDADATIIGYTKREIGEQTGAEVWGTSTNAQPGSIQGVDVAGKVYAPWINSKFRIWSKQECQNTNPDCVEKQYLVIKDQDTFSQKIVNGYITTESTFSNRFEIVEGSSLEVYTDKIVQETLQFSIAPNLPVSIYTKGNIESVISSVNSTEPYQKLSGSLVYGNYYTTDSENVITSQTGEKFSYWIKISTELWKKAECTGICDIYNTTATEGYSEAVTLTFYIKASDAVINESVAEFIGGAVLGVGDTAGNSQNAAEDLISIEDLPEDEDIDWVSIIGEGGDTNKIEKEIYPLTVDAKYNIVVNNAMLDILGLTLDKAVGQSLDATIVFDNALFGKANSIIESEPVKVKIIGVIADGKTPTMYLPLSDLWIDEMVNVSQLKVVLDDQSMVDTARASIEGLGFVTSSVVDTVDSISGVFNILRIALLVLGLIALTVASLGMFNTLTVSLLEKTREVGLLKIMGLKSWEVKSLFLAESLIISVLGGVSGLILAFLLGKLLSLVISLIAATKGQGFMDISYIPWQLGLIMVVISAFVGIITGWYPSKRAKEISALNALRYE